MNDEKIPEGFYINSHKSLQEHILWMGNKTVTRNLKKSV